jgi:hypothetical protein
VLLRPGMSFPQPGKNVPEPNGYSGDRDAARGDRRLPSRAPAVLHRPSRTGHTRSLQTHIAALRRLESLVFPMKKDYRVKLDVH